MDYNQYKNQQYDNKSLMHSETSTVQMFMTRVYGWMAFALLLSGLVAYYAAASGLIVNGIPMIVLFVVTLIMVFAISAFADRLPAPVVALLFVAYSGLMGILLSAIFIVYAKQDIATAFFITAGSFAALSVYGTVTKRDLTAFGSFLFVGLVGLIIASVVNYFLKSTVLYWALSVIGVFIFAGLTAYDTQKLRRIGAQLEGQESSTILKHSISGALTLYLDFVNLFLFILRILGSRR
jgi:FtsH-binding integral membrane protein